MPAESKKLQSSYEGLLLSLGGESSDSKDLDQKRISNIQATSLVEQVRESQINQIMSLLKIYRLGVTQASYSHEHLIDELYGVVSSYWKGINICAAAASDRVKLDAAVKMFYLFPLHTLVDKFADIISSCVLEINNSLNVNYLHFETGKISIENLIPVLEIYAKVLGGLVHSTQLGRIVFKINGYANSKAAAESADIASQINIESPDTISALKDVAISLKDHDYLEVQYLSNYIIESIKILSEPKYANSLLDKSENLVLVGYVLGFEFSQRSLSGYSLMLEEYNDFVTSFITCINSSHEKENWCYNSKLILDMVLAAENNFNCLVYIIESIDKQYDKEEIPCWELTYAMLKALFSEEIKNKTIKTRAVDLAGKIVLKEGSSKELQKVQGVALEILVCARHSTDIALRELSAKKIKEVEDIVNNTNLSLLSDYTDPQDKYFFDDWNDPKDLEAEKNTEALKVNYTLSSFENCLEDLRGQLSRASGETQRDNIKAEVAVLKQKFDDFLLKNTRNGLFVDVVNSRKEDESSLHLIRSLGVDCGSEEIVSSSFSSEDDYSSSSVGPKL